MIAACSEVSSVLASLTDFLDSHAVLGPVWSHSSSIATIEGGGTKSVSVLSFY